MKSRIYSRF